MKLLHCLRRLFSPRGEDVLGWPDDDSWIPTTCTHAEFRLDAGYAVTPYVPGWMLPVGAPDDPPIPLPDLPEIAGHVLTADAVGLEAELVHHFSRLPPLPGLACQREIAPFSSLSVNLLLCLPGEAPVVADMFAGSRLAVASLLDDLSNTAGVGGIVYDNLDQGWALRILVEADAVLVLDWDPEEGDPREGARALRLPRRAVAEQAAASRRRLDHLHATLLRALGRDLWSCPVQD